MIQYNHMCQHSTQTNVSNTSETPLPSIRSVGATDIIIIIIMIKCK